MYTLKEACEFSLEVKKSRFIAHALPVQSIKQATDFFSSQSIASARHNCWAFKVGNDYRFNDDGEPSGTAGKPILAAIEYADLTNVAILVIRWFGGIKLGTGGLCRAYGGSASSCLKAGELIEIRHFKSYEFTSGFDLSAQVHHLFKTYPPESMEETYLASGINWSFTLDNQLLESFQNELKQMTRGQITLKELRA
ncbi:IMPACT family protein [Lentisphaera profundi]|uniref:IMPACT family protein n=1 Tax=Lentisphaera profundi TaxID=1658616 RepID=A0ABY7VMP8_9BACT|nr:YigZ family protein [Lentisphaera profundi]WDE95300.1 IMPACT family protein [Lentisphaera profundi]